MEDDPYVYDSVPFRERKRVTFKCCDDKNAEIDRLRAELAEAKRCRDNAEAALEAANARIAALEDCEATLGIALQRAEARVAELEGALNEIANLDGLGLGDVLDIACNALRYKERAQP